MNDEEDLTKLENIILVGAFMIAGLIVVWCLLELAESIAIAVAK